MTMNRRPTFTHQLLLVAGTVVLLALIWKLADVFVLIFGAVVVAIALRSLVRRVERLGVSARYSFMASLLVVVLVVVATIAWVGDPLAEQLSRLREGLPAALDRMFAWMRGHRIGITVLEYWQSLQDDGLPWERLLGVAGTAIGAMGMFALIIFMGVFLAADPAMYRDGFLRLFPKQQREAVADALEQSADGLRRWLLGQSISMLYVGSVTALGLLALGVPLALSIGLISGLLSFIPFIGALAGGALAVLVAFMEGPATAMHVLILCVAIQQVEGHVLIPLVQRWAVSLPPVLSLVSALVFGILFGIVGVLFATPMMVVLMILVRCMYVERLEQQ
jgi:predicted PurR-regulated permease PerM